eukprot:scaffold28778_cov62-Phaeocystis_antarctica.AAC.3
MGGGSHAAARRARAARGDGGRRHRLVVGGGRGNGGGGGAGVHHLRGSAARGALRVRPRPRLQRLLARRRRAVQEVPDLRPALRRAAGGGARHTRARGAHLRAAQVGSGAERFTPYGTRGTVGGLGRQVFMGGGVRAGYTL